MAKAPVAKPGAPAKKEAPAAKPAAAKAVPKAAPVAAAAAPKDTGSILSEARTTAKPGPMTKAEAAQKGAGNQGSREAGKTKAGRAADAGQAGLCQAEGGGGVDR